jgi:hypothetical protein
MNNTYLNINGDEIVPSSLDNGPYFHIWNDQKNSYIKTKFVPEIDRSKSEAGIKIADKIIRAISGPTFDHEAIRAAKEEFASLTKQ